MRHITRNSPCLNVPAVLLKHVWKPTTAEELTESSEHHAVEATCCMMFLTRLPHDFGGFLPFARKTPIPS